VASKPSIAIYVREGSAAPVVFSTATSGREQRALDAWLTENPELAALVERAIELAERGDSPECLS
jgi:hypothetical protein